MLNELLYPEIDELSKTGPATPAQLEQVPLEEQEIQPDIQPRPTELTSPIDELRTRLEESYPIYKKLLDSQAGPPAELSVEGKMLPELERQLQLLETQVQENLEVQLQAARQLEGATKRYWDKISDLAEDIEILLKAKQDVLKAYEKISPWKIGDQIDFLKAGDELDNDLHRARIRYARLGLQNERFTGERDRLYQKMHYLNDDLDRLRAQIAGHKAAIQTQQHVEVPLPPMT